MTFSLVVQLGRELLLTAMLLALPTVLVSLVVGLLISIFQTITSIQEQTLSFAPRILAVGVAAGVYSALDAASTGQFHKPHVLADLGNDTMNPLQYWVTAWVLVIARVSMFVATFPLFRSGTIPRLVKIAFCLSLSVLWLTLLASDPSGRIDVPAQDHWVSYGVAVGREMVLGGMLGYALGLFLLPAQIAGAYLGQEMGFSLANMTDPSSDLMGNAFGNLVQSLAILAFLAADIHQLAIGTLYSSFLRMPIGAPLQIFRSTEFSQGVADAHRWGLELAAPLALCLFLTTILLAILIRMSPHLNLFSIGISLRLAAGLITAFLILPGHVRLAPGGLSSCVSFRSAPGPVTGRRPRGRKGRIWRAWPSNTHKNEPKPRRRVDVRKRAVRDRSLRVLI